LVNSVYKLRPLFTPVVGNVTASSRDRIFDAARTLFERDGFAATGVREIAARAGVTPALVIRYYGSKEALLLATMGADETITQIVRGPLEDLGRELVRHILEVSAPGFAGRGVFGALVRASDREAVRQRLRQTAEVTTIGPLRERLDGPDADLRARLVSAALLGLITAIEIFGDTDLIAADVDRLTAIYGSTIQSLVDPACGGTGHASGSLPSSAPSAP
jgi:AcrR family transcriptional regulator